MTKTYRVNRDIQSPLVRVVYNNVDGDVSSIVKIEEALSIANSQDMDLVEVGVDQDPPVCRIMNYGRFMYHKSKKEKETKRNAKSLNKVRSVRLTPQISNNDLTSKANVVRSLLNEGAKVRVEVLLKGRQKGNPPETVINVLKSVFNQVSDKARLEVPPRMETRGIYILLAPIVNQSANEEK